MNNTKKTHLCIGVVFYNHEEQLSSNQSILEGLLNQNLENIEHTIIFADDSSKDNTRGKLDEFIKKNKQLNIIKKYAKKNLGYSGNRNSVINEIPEKTTHFFFVDGDDYMEKGFISTSLEFMLNNSLDFLLVPISRAIRIPFKKDEWHSVDNWKKLVLSKQKSLSRRSLLKNHWLSAPWPYMIRLDKIKIQDLIYAQNSGTYLDMYTWFPLQVLAIIRKIKGDKLLANENTPSYVYFKDGYSTKTELLNAKRLDHIFEISEMTMKKIENIGNKKMAKKFFYIILSNQFFCTRRDFESDAIYQYFKKEKKDFINRNELNRLLIFINKGWIVYLSRILRKLKIIRRQL